MLLSTINKGSPSKLEQLEAEHGKLMQIFDRAKKEYERIKDKVRGKSDYEQSEK